MNSWDNKFIQLAETDPEALLKVCASKELPTWELTFALEALGMVPQHLHAKAMEILTENLTSDVAMVREGVVLGLALLATENVAAIHTLHEIAANDTNALVRQVANEVIIP